MFDEIKWTITITVDRPGRMAQQQAWYVAHGNVLELARIVSAGSPGASVSLAGHARTRAIFKDGKLFRDCPRLDEFYTDVDPETQRIWESGRA
jgi:hypothetical protein